MYRSVTAITGAASGIGKGIAMRLAHDGAAVVLVDIDVTGLTEVRDAIMQHGGRPVAMVADVAVEGSLEDLPRRAYEEFGQPLSGVVCNAGIQALQPIDTMSGAEFDRILRVNVLGTFLSLQMGMRALLATGTGAMVTISSIQGRLGNPDYPHYSASKAAILDLTKSFARRLARDHIRVNSVAPGIVDTPLWERLDQDYSRIHDVPAGTARSHRIDANLMGRPGTVNDVAAAVSFLLSEDASYITGECIHVAGGDLML